MLGNNKGPVGKIKQKLYAKKNDVGEIKRIKLKPKKYSVNSEWTYKDNSGKVESKKDPEFKPRKKMTFYTKFFLFSFVFFLISIFSAFFIFNSGANQITYDKVLVGIQGPNYISAGDNISFIVSISNKNSESIVLSDIYVNYPEGTVEPGEPNIPLLRDRESFEEILPGETKEVKLKAIIYGSEGDTKKIQVRYEYRVNSSNAIYHKEKDYDVRISTSPLNVSGKHVEKILSGGEIEVNIDISSNSTDDIGNLALEVDYPFGFIFKESTPKPTVGENIWDIGTVLTAENKTIKIIGVVNGQNEEERVFRYSVGSKSKNDLTEIGSIFSSTESIVSIKTPDISIDFLANREKGNTTVFSGQRVEFELNLVNNLNSKIVDPNIEVDISGNFFDDRRLEVDGGFYNSITKKVIWSKQTEDSLKEIEKGELKKFKFKVPVREDLGGQIENPEVTLKVKAIGDSFGSDGNEKVVFGEAQKVIKLNSDVILTGGTFHDDGPIENTGRIPPKVGEQTTYTILWDLSSSVNKVEEATVVATLPLYVTYLGSFTPSSEKIFYDDRKKEITWQAGTIDAFSGFSKDSKKIYFKVGIVPSLSQVGREIPIFNSKRITAYDTFTQEEIEKEETGETTKLLDTRSGFKEWSVVE